MFAVLTVFVLIIGLWILYGYYCKCYCLLYKYSVGVVLVCCFAAAWFVFRLLLFIVCLCGLL